MNVPWSDLLAIAHRCVRLRFVNGLAAMPDSASWRPWRACRLGWVGGLAVTLGAAAVMVFAGLLITRLQQLVPRAKVGRHGCNQQRSMKLKLCLYANLIPME